MEKMPKLKECGTHEKRKENGDEIQHLCESCGRTYYICDICRAAKNVEAPANICMKCAPALKTLKQILTRKDTTIQELQDKVKKLETDSKGYHDMADTIKKQFASTKRQNEEFRIQLKNHKDELEELKHNHGDMKVKYEALLLEKKTRDKLVKDLKGLLENKYFTDLTINVGNEVFNVNKCIVAARSEPLNKSLEPVLDPKDKKQQRKLDVNNLQFADVSEHAMPIFLNYLYTGSVDKLVNEDNVTEVLKLADKFELVELRELCLGYMSTKINRSTVIPILIQASHYNDEKLKTKCIEYINRDAIDLIESPQWKNLKRENPTAALDLYEARIKNLHEQEQIQTRNTPRSNGVNNNNNNYNDDDELKTSRKADAVKTSGKSVNSKQYKPKS